MAESRQARHRSHEIRTEIDDDGNPAVIVDGEAVPVRQVEGGFAITYFEPHDDLMQAAKRYVDRLPRA